jgi:hypothetical protein
MVSKNWFLIRNDLSQASSEGTEASVKSPDIITRSSQASPEELTSFSAEYNKDFSQKVDYQGTNYIYIRAKDLATEVAIGSVSLWYCLLQNLDEKNKWTRLSTQDGNNVVTIHALGQDVTVSETPFVMSNIAPPSQGSPYCLVAFVTDKMHLAPTDEPLKEAILEAANATYRTLSVPEAPPSPASEFGWSSSVKLNNSESIPVMIQLSVSQFDTDAEMYFILDKPDADGNIISIGKSQLVADNVYSTQATLPKNYASKISAYYFANASNNEKISAEFSIQILELREQVVPGVIRKQPKVLEEFSVFLSQRSICC